MHNNENYQLFQLSGIIIWLAPFQTMTGEALVSILHLEDQISCFSTSPNNKTVLYLSSVLTLFDNYSRHFN